MNSDNRIERKIGPKAVAILLLISAVILFCLFLFRPEHSSSSTACKEETYIEAVEDIIEPPHVINGAIAKKSSLYASLNEAGLPSGLVHNITCSLQEVFDLKRSSPGDAYTLEYYPPQELVSFEYRPPGLDEYLIIPKDNLFKASMRPKDLDRCLRRVKGKIKGTLWGTMVKMGENPALIAKLADIFEWEIDFLTDVRDGDEFDLVIESFNENGKIVFYGDIQVARYSLQGVDYFGILYEEPGGDRAYFDLDGKSLRKTLLKSPINYRRISSKYSLSRMHPILKIRRPHYGVDYVAKKGTPVVAAGDGRVIYKGWKGDYGKTIILRHGNGFQTYYGHLSGYAKKLSKGKKVKQGQLIGYVGSTGLSTGPHLDYRIKKNGKYTDPLKLDPPSVRPVQKKYLADFIQVRDEILTTMRSLDGDHKLVIAKSR